MPIRSADPISRTRDPRDARKNALALTAAGRTLLRRLEELGDQANEVLLAPLTPAEREQLGALLTRLIVEEAEGVR